MNKFIVVGVGFLSLVSNAGFAGVFELPLESHPWQGEVRVIEDSKVSLFSFNEGVAMEVETAGLVRGNYPSTCFA